MNRQHVRLSRLLTGLLCIILTGSTSAQDNGNMISRLNVGNRVVSGQWRLVDGELRVGRESNSRIVLSDSAPTSYSLTIEFTRTSGDNSIAVVLPVGGSQCAFIMSAFDGEAHGIGVIDGKLAKENSTTITPGKLKSGHPYRLMIEVEVNGAAASIDSTLDGRPFLKWRGKPKSLTMLDFWKLPTTSSVGLCTYAETTFHSIRLMKLDPSMRMAGTGANERADSNRVQKSIRFENRVWVAPQAESIDIEDFKGKRALHIKGGENNFVALSDVDFGDGMIEVDIASATFSGIGFRGNSEQTTVEKLYFRPFNSGTAKHENTVQYSMLGKTEFGWKALRVGSPGKYEAGAEIKTDEWFHARIVLKGERMTTYVNDDPHPVLVVDRLLGERATGSIGVWGWDSYFANFRFTPAGDK